MAAAVLGAQQQLGLALALVISTSISDEFTS
jgi:hypothetical protein